MSTTWNPEEPHYIVGVQSSNKTFAGYVAKPVVVCVGRTCYAREGLIPTTTRGDGTVPLVSAQRSASGMNPDGGDVAIHRIDASSSSDDSSAEHLGMTQHITGQNLILQLLAGQVSIKKADIDRPLPPAEPAYYLNVFGSGAAYVTSADGQVTGAISPTLTLNQAGEIAYFPSSTGNFLVVIPTTGAYTVTFASGVEPMFIELVREGDLRPDYAVRWQQLSLPPNATVQLLISPSGVQELTYDNNGDGAPETVLPPTIELTGPEAQDTQPPTVDAHITIGAGGVEVELTAIDNESGVGTIFYSLNGTEYQPYSAPFVVSPLQTDAIYAFADDNAANRSGLFAFPLGIDVSFLPIISTGGGSPQ